MNDQRREILIGYLLDVLEPQETVKIDAELQTNEVLRNDPGAIYREISPISEMVDGHEPPLGLASRTCQKIWAKIDSAQKLSKTASTDTETTAHPHISFCKKRKITVNLSRDDEPQEEPSNLPPPASCPSQDLNTDDVIPLSHAILLATPDRPRKPNETLCRVDQAENTPREMHLMADSMIIAKRHPPKYYGHEKKTEKVKSPLTVRDIFVSLFVGLAAAILIFPLVQLGIGCFRGMIIQKKVENVAKSMPPNTSQYSHYGMSQNDIRAFAGMNMNIDPQSAGVPHGQGNNAVPSSAGTQEHESLPVPAVTCPP